MTWEEFINSKYNPNSPDTGGKVFWLAEDSTIKYIPYTKIHSISDAYGAAVINSAKVYIAYESGGSDA